MNVEVMYSCECGKIWYATYPAIRIPSENCNECGKSVAPMFDPPEEDESSLDSSE